MPRRLKTHVGANLWLWTGIMAVFAAVAADARMRIGVGDHLGDIMALALMVGSTMVILISQRHGSRPVEADGER